MIPESYKEAVKILEKNISGLSSHVAEYDLEGCIRIYFKYLCPCGEVSHSAYAFDKTHAFSIEFFVSTVSHELRTHVISEGNTPNF